MYAPHFPHCVSVIEGTTLRGPEPLKCFVIQFFGSLFAQGREEEEEEKGQGV